MIALHDAEERVEQGEAMTESSNQLIHIEGLTKVFYTDEIETHALSGVHLSIARGEYVAMSGPSGCGKSTARPAFCRACRAAGAPVRRQGGR